jgi:hypothetical protein
MTAGGAEPVLSLPVFGEGRVGLFLGSLRPRTPALPENGEGEGELFTKWKKS